MFIRSLMVTLMMLTCSLTYSQSLCDIRLGKSESVGVRVVEFASAQVIHSKMSIKDTTADALMEEYLSLQDMGVCSEKVVAKKCTLKYVKVGKNNLVSMYRGQDKWLTWMLKSKPQAEQFIKNLKRVGFCS